MDKNEYLTQWAEKLSLSKDEINAEFNRIFAEEKTIHIDLDEDQQTKRTLQRLALIYKKQLRSPAIGFEGIIIAASDCIDIVAKQKREAIALYRTDPQTAIGEGVTNEEGVPLDTKATWSTGRVNPRFGKPLPDNNFLRNIYGVAMQSKTKEMPKFFSMTLSGKKATDENLPMFKPTRFMAINKTQQETEAAYQLNSSSFTNFVVDEKMDLPEYKTLIATHVETIKMSELESYHTLNKDNFNRLVAVEGDVSMLNLEPTSVGSRVMAVEDPEASLEDLDSKGLTCWTPERIKIDFAEGSKVIVLGRTAQGKKKNEQGELTEELGDVTLNVFGLYAIPEYKIALPKSIQELSEDDLEVN